MVINRARLDEGKPPENGSSAYTYDGLVVVNTV
jgi:hypothetical protein